ncbi:MAG TPA: HNH endonuclease [Acidimicrobiales bacterium]|nr:HNH endonuclease [Acidimicrobiales bacterium]
MSRALVLNASYEPLCVVSTRRALVLVLDDKAEMVKATDKQFRSEKLALPEPSVVRLAHYVRVPYQTRIALNRRAVFARDDHRCQYCGSAAENIDHVVPRSRGGTHTWDNVVAACRPCNTRKEDRLLSETSLQLRHPPRVPRERTWILVATGGHRPDWEPYLGEAASLSA